MYFRDLYRGKRAFLTGHTGFKGSWLTTWLLHLGASVCGYSKGIPTQPSLFESASLSNLMEHCIGDVRDLDQLTRSIHSFRPDFLFHLAAQPIVSTSYADPIETITTNVVGTAHVLEAMRGVDWPCVAVIITSDKCYDNVEWVWGYRESDRLGGKDVYSGSKGAAELVFKSYWHSFFSGHDASVKLATARAGNVIGGGDWAVDRIVADCIRAWQRGERVHIRRPSATRPWQHVLEPLSGYLALGQQLALSGTGNGDSFNFGPQSEQNRTVGQMVGDLGSVWGISSANEGYETGEEPSFHEAGLLKLNCDKALIELSWEPTLTYSECIQMTGLWYRHALRESRSALEYTTKQIEEYQSRAHERCRRWATEA
jgi:CDP-glucose 4,6-dehydratase